MIAYKREFQKIGGSFKQLAETFNLDSGARKCGIKIYWKKKSKKNNCVKVILFTIFDNE